MSKLFIQLINADVLIHLISCSKWVVLNRTLHTIIRAKRSRL